MRYTLYGLVRSWPATGEDFRSNAAKGHTPRGAEIAGPELVHRAMAEAESARRGALPLSEHR
ncbi:MAG: hypothetical protein AVDCRST_MAG77-1646 [uncultured Chloroflexi bacterium]|uniref:Uncharacterized protein n=1 Tax=uncultured Chloroflexota bacterium TaxID=166587 RepID=A0A6J4I2B4_9CHLR|nr:MAG: hypothetical protein AVDCRST_MAG77-1646 [uncultured Chloroflexota bacterium]